MCNVIICKGQRLAFLSNLHFTLAVEMRLSNRSTGSNSTWPMRAGAAARRQWRRGFSCGSTTEFGIVHGSKLRHTHHSCRNLWIKISHWFSPAFALEFAALTLQETDSGYLLCCGMVHPRARENQSLAYDAKVNEHALLFVNVAVIIM